MPPPKKAAKKTAGKHAPQEDAAKDMRRAYEHLGRVEVLHASLEKHAAAEVTSLTRLAQQQLAAEHVKDAADLLRAAEHLSFGAIGSTKKDLHVDPKLVEAISSEFKHKLEKAEEHWSKSEQKNEKHNQTVEQIFTAAKDRALKAFADAAYRPALEWARGAEALAHVHIQQDAKLGAGTTQHKLTT